MRRIGCLAALAIIITAISPLDVAHAKPSPAAHAAPSFVVTECPAGVFRPARDVECGYIRVPENRGDPTSRWIKVRAAIVHSRGATHVDDPIVFLDGGPSFGAISPFALDFYFAGSSLNAERDVILVDTRGTGTSTPRLGCPELDRANIESFYSGRRIDANVVPIFTKAIRACRERQTAKGIDVSAYNSAESAADLDDLRQALGVDDWNLLAISADGVLGLTYLRLFPDHIRSAIFDSAMSTQMEWGFDYDRGLAGMLDAIFAGCHANTACHARYPGIAHRFLRLVNRLNERPKLLRFPNFRPEPVTFKLDGVVLYLDTVHTIFPGDKSTPDDIGFLLRTVWKLTHGKLIPTYRAGIGNGPLVNDHANRFLPAGKSLSYICHDQVNFLTKADRHQAALDLPVMASRYLDPGYDFTSGYPYELSPAGCRTWDVGVADPAQFEPVSSDVPALVLAGEFDQGVPASIVAQLPPTLSESTYVEIPASAHLQLASYNAGSDCARAITVEFLGAPGTALDVSCVDNLPPFDFTPASSPDGRQWLTAQVKMRMRSTSPVK